MKDVKGSLFDNNRIQNPELFWLQWDLFHHLLPKEESHPKRLRKESKRSLGGFNQVILSVEWAERNPYSGPLRVCMLHSVAKSQIYANPVPQLRQATLKI